MSVQLRHIILILLCLLTACGTDTGIDPTEGRTVRLHLIVPAVDAATRALGDPGTSVTLPYPTKAWLFFVNQDNKVVQLRDEDNNYISNPIALPAPAVISYWGNLSTTYDEVYNYPAGTVKLPPGSNTGAFYLLMADVALTSGGTPIENLLTYDTSTLNDLLNLTFDATSEVRTHLQNIYSTPYNYNIGTPSRYYGTLTDADETVELMLYHVAARVDVQWNVVGETFQATHKVSTLAVGDETDNLKERNCFLFKPMANVGHGTGGYTLPALKTDTEVSRQWYGRTSFYTIPYTAEGKFTFPLVVNGQTTLVRLNMSGADPVFAPWIRVNLKYDEPEDFEQTTLELN